MVATTLVIVIAALCAFSHANTAMDLGEMKRRVGYAGIIFCILLFLFGIGLLSGWRADSTKEGIALVVEGYRSLTKIDVFVTAVINGAGFIFLTREFKRFFWPNPLFHYAQRKTTLNDKKADIERIKNELNTVLDEARGEIEHNSNRIDELLRVMDKFQRTVAKKMEDASNDFEELVAHYQGKYAKKNREYRTEDAYMAPAWLEKCILTVSNEATRQNMEKRFQEEYRDYDADGHLAAEKYKAYQQRIRGELNVIEQARSTIEEITKKAF